MDAILARLPRTGWEWECINKLQIATNLTQGLVDGAGHPVSQLDENTWGIDYQTCQRYCSRGSIPIPFDFNTFSSSATNYLLPWLALTAQLPYETGSPMGDVMSFCLAVGSPVLITYSLTLTVLNRYWIQERFDKLYEKSQGPSVEKRYPEYGIRIRNIQYFLQEAQQVSIRVSQTNGWLSSLVVLPRNQEWWQELRKRLKRSRRDRTASLFWQMALAIITYALTTTSSFIALLGDADSGLQISSGTLWLWLLPVIAGWILVGTQIGPKSIPDALNEGNAYRAMLRSADERPQIAEEPQEGLELESDFAPRRFNQQRITGHDREKLTPPNFAWAAVTGDERRTGPIYNYARIFTWWSLSNSFANAIDATLDNISQGNTPHDQVQSLTFLSTVTQNPGQSQNPLGINLHMQTIAHTPPHSRGSSHGKLVENDPVVVSLSNGWDDLKHVSTNLSGDCTEIAQYCGLTLDQNPIAYPSRRSIPDRLIGHILFSVAVALFVQWGTAGPAIWIAYLTPAPGLGCRSGGYLLYATVAMAVWLLLTTSGFLSHYAMLLYQDKHLQNPEIDLRICEHSLRHSILCYAAVFTRRFGKVLAILNAGWIILGSFFELIGVYQSCWCNANGPGLGQSGWVMLFKVASDLKQAAEAPWISGVAVAAACWLVSISVFYMGTKSSDSMK